MAIGWTDQHLSFLDSLDFLMVVVVTQPRASCLSLPVHTFHALYEMKRQVFPHLALLESKKKGCSVFLL